MMSWWWSIRLLHVQVLASIDASWLLLTLSLSFGHLGPGHIVGSELVEWAAGAALPRRSKVGVLTAGWWALLWWRLRNIWLMSI